MKVWEALEKLKQDGPYLKSLGICAAAEDCLDLTDSRWIWLERASECMKSWVEYSGNPFYPVPSVNFSPGYAYNETPDEDMWNPDHEYGAARLRLLDYCIEWFKTKDL